MKSMPSNMQHIIFILVGATLSLGIRYHNHVLYVSYTYLVNLCIFRHNLAPYGVQAIIFDHLYLPEFTCI